MKKVLFLVEKEFLQIMRNKTMLPMIFVMPIVQTILLSFAASYEVKDLKINIINHDNAPFAQELVGKFEASPNFDVRQDGSMSMVKAQEQMEADAVDLILWIPSNFERDLVRDNSAKIQLIANAVNAQKAGIATAYAQSIIRDFAGSETIKRHIIIESSLNRQAVIPSKVDVISRNWYNPELEYKYFMTPGILGEITSLIICFLTAINLVRERELGTMEQLNVTPIKKWQFILGKFIPFWIISLFIITVGLTVGKLLFDIPMIGSLGLVFLYTALYMPCVLGLGFLISNFAESQQQALFTAFFLLIIFILMCGLFTPLDNIPSWAKVINYANPIQYFVDFMRKVLLKGATFWDVRQNIATVIVYGIVVNVLAVWTYQKRA